MNRETKIYCLAYGCPKTNRNNNDCPLLEIEHLSFKERIDNLDDERQEAILTHRASCTNKSK